MRSINKGHKPFLALVLFTRLKSTMIQVDHTPKASRPKFMTKHPLEGNILLWNYSETLGLDSRHLSFERDDVRRAELDALVAMRCEIP